MSAQVRPLKCSQMLFKTRQKFSDAVQRMVLHFRMQFPCSAMCQDNKLICFIKAVKCLYSARKSILLCLTRKKKVSDHVNCQKINYGKILIWKEQLSQENTL